MLLVFMGTQMGYVKDVRSKNHSNTLSLNEPSIQPIPRTNQYIKAATSDNTRRAYQSDIRHFQKMGGKLPADTEAVLTYLHQCADKINPRTLTRRLSALKQWHLFQGFQDPTNDPAVSKTLKGIRRVHGKPKEKARALSPDELKQMVEYLNAQNTLKSLRDSALLQVGFFGAFRRSELVNIRYEDIAWQEHGIEITIPKSKTDQENEGQFVALPKGTGVLCPIRALNKWLEASAIKEGFIFRGIKSKNTLLQAALNPAMINQILKTIAGEINLDNINALSSHSLRRGLATSANLQGASIASIMRQGRWKNVDTIMEYIEAGQRFEENAAGSILHE